MLTVPAAELTRQLTRIAGTGGSVNDPIFILFTNSPATFSAAPVPSDFTRPAYYNYADVPGITWGTPFTNGSGQAEVTGQNLNFAVTDSGSGSGPASVITGAALLSTDGTKVILYEVFPTPRTLQYVGDGFGANPRYAIGSPS